MEGPTLSSAEDRAVELQFPVLPFDPRLVESISLSSSPSRPRIMSARPDDAESALGDSHYEHITESDFQTSDDDDLDDPAVSVSARGLDDLSSVSDLNELTSTSSQADPIDTPSEDEESNVAGSFHQSEPAEASAHPEINDSGMTVTNEKVRPCGPAPDSSIEFEEPSFRSDLVAVMHTVRNLDADEARRVFERHSLRSSPARVALTIRQTMSKGGLAIEDSFRALYIGDPSGKTRIMEKVARSLAVSAFNRPGAQILRYPSARFNIVPVSDFGGDQSPEVTLVPSSGINLCFDECTAADDRKLGPDAHELSLRINDTFWIQSPNTRDADSPLLLAPSKWQLPHVAISFSPSSETAHAIFERLVARAFMKRHGVPVIDISEKPALENPVDCTIQDTHSLHMCLESRGPGDQGQAISKRLPVDLETFLNIDERQMNRNFAFLTGLQTGGDALTQRTRTRRTIPKAEPKCGDADVEKLTAASSGSYDYSGLPGISLWNTVRRERWSRSVLWFLALTFPLVWFCSGLYNHYIELPSSSSAAPSLLAKHPHGDASSLGVATLMSASEAPVLTTSSVTFRPKPSDAGKDAKGREIVESSKVEPSSKDLDRTATSANESDEFKLQVVGCCHVILKPPRRYTSLKKAPSMTVEIRRLEQLIDARLTKLFDGVYELALKPEDAYDALNVTVSTRSTQQTFYLDFGRPWLSVAGWKSRALFASQRVQKELLKAQEGLGSALGHASMDMQTVLNHTKTAALATRHEAERLRKLSLQRTEGPRHMVAARARALSKEASARGVAWSKEASGKGVAWSKELALRSHAVSLDVYSRAVELYKTQATRSRWPDLSHVRKSNALSLITYQKKARNVWRHVVSTELPRANAQLKSFEDRIRSRYSTQGCTKGCTKACKKCKR